MFFLGLTLLSYASYDSKGFSTDESHNIYHFSDEQLVSFIEDTKNFLKNNSIKDIKIKDIIFSIFKNDDLFDLIESDHAFYRMMRARKNWSSKSICQILCYIDKYLRITEEDATRLIFNFIDKSHIKISQEQFEKILPRIIHWDMSIPRVLNFSREKDIIVGKNALIETVNNYTIRKNPKACVFEHILDYALENHIHFTKKEIDDWHDKIKRLHGEKEEIKDVAQKLESLYKKEIYAQ